MALSKAGVGLCNSNVKFVRTAVIRLLRVLIVRISSGQIVPARLLVSGFGPENSKEGVLELSHFQLAQLSRSYIAATYVCRIRYIMELIGT